MARNLLVIEQDAARVELRSSDCDADVTAADFRAAQRGEAYGVVAVLVDGWDGGYDWTSNAIQRPTGSQLVNCDGIV